MNASEGLVSVKVSTAAANTPARALYRSIGFSTVSTRESPEGIILIDLELKLDVESRQTRRGV